MHIVLATPLYPPDIAPPAPYIKELAKRLQTRHKVNIVTYGKLPEQVAGVAIIAVSKNRMLFMRLWAYTFALVKAVRGADILYAQNGASVELPALLVSLVTRTPLVVGISDDSAHVKAAEKKTRRLLESAVTNRAASVVTGMPLPRPEILPFGPKPDAELRAYDASWQEHIHRLEGEFARVTKHGN